MGVLVKQSFFQKYDSPLEMRSVSCRILEGKLVVVLTALSENENRSARYDELTLLHV
jgi:hypothetical protein